jgi:hypothetical protein
MIADGVRLVASRLVVFVQFLDAIHILDKESVREKDRSPAIRRAWL